MINFETYEDEYRFYFKEWLETEYEPLPKNPEGGTPWKFLTPTALAEKCVEYFVWKMENSKPISVRTLCLFLNISAMGLDNYKGYSQAFCDLVNKIKLLAECYNVEAVYDKDLRAGAMFVLKANFGYQETSVVITEQRDFKIGRTK